MSVITRRLLKKITKSYLIGLLHDGTERRYTYRICQKEKEFIHFVAKEMQKIGIKAWTYQEGKKRNLWVVEFAKKHLSNIKINSLENKIDYICGFFDADGGIAQSCSVRFYIYFAQKDRLELERVKGLLKKTGINSGKLHNPSRKKDPDYWRFYISADPYNKFADKIGSCHPRKNYLLRMVR
jgi:hypothetical protein